MKKVLSLIVALCLMLGCTVSALAIDVDLPIFEEKETFTWMIAKESLSQNTWPEKECVQFTEEKTNIHLECIEIASSGWDEKVNLAFTSGDLPDCFVGGVDVAINYESLAAIEGIIDECAPNILRTFEDLPELRGALTLPDGHIYSLPTGDADVKNMINGELWINTTWLEKVGKEMPTTVDEFVDVLRAFRDEDPNGNGQKDEIPLLASGASSAAYIRQMMGFFGTLDNSNHIRVEDGKVIFTPAEDGYFQALQWLHLLYSEGLLNQDYYTEDNTQFLAKGQNEVCTAGVLLEWYIDTIMYGPYVSQYAPIEPFEGSLWNKSRLPQGSLNGFVISSSCRDVAAMVRYYDYVNSDLDILNLWNYGPEGVIWRYLDDGRWEVFTDNVPEGSSSSQVRRTLGVGPTCPMYAYSRWRGPQAEKYADRITAKVAANELYLKHTPVENMPAGYGDIEETAERNLLLIDIDQYLDPFFADAVVNGITEEAWQQHLKVLDTLSIDEYIGYWQTFYDQHT